MTLIMTIEQSDFEDEPPYYDFWHKDEFRAMVYWEDSEWIIHIPSGDSGWGFDLTESELRQILDVCHTLNEGGTIYTER